jgi:hypothetical protein
MNKLILIEKYLPSSIFWLNLEKDKNINLSVEEILNKYKGFEGELILMFGINKGENKTKEYIEECSEYKNICNSLLLFIIPNPPKESFIDQQALYVGYDVGICDEETICSSIFHEILFGKVNELVAFKEFLNENLLFPNKFLAEKYIETHNEMSVQERNVEDYYTMTSYEIWKHKDWFD